ncbi:hypothetical protein [Aphanothece sacrum]|uniref:RUN domain-containing protein n=1 Tax=Aphanothece sacrum FPU1 TaxID=1920663 RepID=A0A401IHN8_APHSA|nr:hypothetical protein [Aphanothece sacrum]GBF80661.1 RUN domain-containing protein [Aphanothece sacrum FPU1]GBF83155.1 hypothetical protein AsFPU3_0194 [Aphanothece sacrum FPU3]
MNENLRNHLGQVEIADLIEASVANAALRRQQVLEDSLIDISDEESKNIEGGLAFLPPIVLGIFYPDPFPIGIILKDPIIPKF